MTEKSVRCWCGETFTGKLRHFLLSQHQKRQHPGDPKNV